MPPSAPGPSQIWAGPEEGWVMVRPAFMQLSPIRRPDPCLQPQLGWGSCKRREPGQGEGERCPRRRPWGGLGWVRALRKGEWGEGHQVCGGCGRLWWWWGIPEVMGAWREWDRCALWNGKWARQCVQTRPGRQTSWPGLAKGLPEVQRPGRGEPAGLEVAAETKMGQSQGVCGSSHWGSASGRLWGVGKV